MHHADTGADVGVTTLVLGAVLVIGFVTYGTLVVAARRRGRRWSWWRTLAAAAGAIAGIVAVGPLAQAGHHDFVAHMTSHLLLGMATPLLLAVAAPVTLALRGLDVHAGRGLTAVLRTPLVRAVGHPVVAAALNVGGLWLLYTTELYHWMHSSTLGHLLVHVHVLLAGFVFTAAVLQIDPAPHPRSVRLRAVVIVAFLATHAVLAKLVYAHPPHGVDTAQARAGAELMYYGGDVVDVALIVVFCWGVYRRAAPRVAAAT